jgi:hypothetical protein
VPGQLAVVGCPAVVEGVVEGVAVVGQLDLGGSTVLGQLALGGSTVLGQLALGGSTVLRAAAPCPASWPWSGAWP